MLAVKDNTLFPLKIVSLFIHLYTNKQIWMY